MSKKLQIGAFFLSAVFLLTLFMQPVHQLSHLSHYHHADHSHESSNPQSVQHETLCSLCDFTLPLTTDFSLTYFELNIPKSETFSVQYFELIQIFVSEVLGINQLRAPPVFA